MAHAQPYSMWARWDPHLHAPGTAKNDRFDGNWDRFKKRIQEAEPPAVALGITDYCSLRCYLRFLEEVPDPTDLGLVYVFPNIEFRLSHQTAKGLPPNIHLLIASEPTDHVARIHEALSRLVIKSRDQPIPATEEGLIRLGRIEGGTELGDNEALALGIEQHKVDHSLFSEWYSKETWLRKHSLVAIAGGNDGLAGVRRHSGFRQLHNELVRESHVVFSATPSDREYFLGQGVDGEETVTSLFGGLRPCLHGSDAHSIGAVLSPDEDRFCWIKSTPSFEGLKQVLYEPRYRVHIGPEPPEHFDPDRVIESVEIAGAGEWFGTTAIPLSESLSAIIGEKGSGKTALLDLVALAGGAFDPQDEGTFLAKAADHLRDLSVTIRWKSGRDSTGRLRDQDARSPEVRYLSQHFVEKLCSGQTLSEELLREIERVIFDHIPRSERRRASDFTELKSRKTQSLKSRQVEIRKGLLAFNAKAAEFHEVLAGVVEKRQELAGQESEVTRLGEEIKKLLTSEQEGSQERLEVLRARKAAVERRIAEALADIDRLQDVADHFSHLRAHVAGELAQIKESLDQLGIESARLGDLDVVFKGDLPGTVAAEQKKIRTKVAALQAAPPDEDVEERKDSTDTLSSLDAALELEKMKLKLEADRAKKVAGLQKSLDQAREKVQSLKDALDEAERVKENRLPRLLDERRDAYLTYFSVLNEEREVLKDLYSPIDTGLAERDGAESELGFQVVTEVDLASWIKRGEGMLDFRRQGWFAESGAIEKRVRSGLLDAWRLLDADTVRAQMMPLLDELKEADVSRCLRKEYTVADFFDWLFEIQHISLEYTIEYRGVELKYLSPGGRGIVLLILYLGLDTIDSRPLLIDQPEENLDNASVYSVLVKYFRRAKQDRQVLVATHNPNLVVNTDAEAIVCANAERRENELPKISYRIGPIEDTGDDELPPIKEVACSVLEGGEAAFLRRELRYELAGAQSSLV